MKITSTSASKKKLAFTVLLLLSILIGVVIALLVNAATKTTQAVVVVNKIKQGNIITAEDVTPIEMASFNVPGSVARDVNEVVGRYAVRDFYPQELVFSSSVTNDYPKRLSDKAKYGAIAIPISMLDSVTGDIKENDFISILVSMRKDEENAAMSESSSSLPSTSTALIHARELDAVRVLGLYQGSGQKYDKETGEGSPSMLVVDALPVQRILLNQARDNGSIRVIILPEYIQQAFRQVWGLTPDDEDIDYNKLLQNGSEVGSLIEESHMSLSDENNLDKIVKDKIKDINGADVTDMETPDETTVTEDEDMNNNETTDVEDPFEDTDDEIKDGEIKDDGESSFMGSEETEGEELDLSGNPEEVVSMLYEKGLLNPISEEEFKKDVIGEMNEGESVKIFKESKSGKRYVQVRDSDSSEFYMIVE